MHTEEHFSSCKNGKNMQRKTKKSRHFTGKEGISSPGSGSFLTRFIVNLILMLRNKLTTQLVFVRVPTRSGENGDSKGKFGATEFRKKASRPQYFRDNNLYRLLSCKFRKQRESP